MLFFIFIILSMTAAFGFGYYLAREHTRLEMEHKKLLEIYEWLQKRKAEREAKEKPAGKKNAGHVCHEERCPAVGLHGCHNMNCLAPSTSRPAQPYQGVCYTCRAPAGQPCDPEKHPENRRKRGN